MTPNERAALAELIHSKREALQLSVREVGRRADVHAKTIMLLEAGSIAQPYVDTIRGLATALDIPLADMYTALNWMPDDSLPSLRPYMRATYHNLSSEAVDQIEDYIDYVVARHGSTGPTGNEDEH